MPEDDGGTPIKHFVVELCDITTNNLWTSVAMSDSGDSCEQLVQHLREGHKYSLRVAAANRIGQSETADLYEEVITKDPWGKMSVFSCESSSSISYNLAVSVCVKWPLVKCPFMCIIKSVPCTFLMCNVLSV